MYCVLKWSIHNVCHCAASAEAEPAESEDDNKEESSLDNSDNVRGVTFVSESLTSELQLSRVTSLLSLSWLVSVKQSRLPRKLTKIYQRKDKPVTKFILIKKKSSKN